MNTKQLNTQVTAVRTAEGFIEIVSLQAIDHIVGGLLAPEEAVCLLEPQRPELPVKSTPIAN